MKKYLSCLAMVAVMSLSAYAQKDSLIGRWDLEVEVNGKVKPSWLEIRASGYESLVGRFVYAGGSARPVSEVVFNDKGAFSFIIPPQWDYGLDQIFTGTFSEGKLTGTMRFSDGVTYSWKGYRAPALKDVTKPKWGKAIKLFNGKDLDGWKVDRDENQWIVEDGILTSPKSGANLISVQTFNDFKLIVAFRYQENGNSGVFLRGRYETQIFDSYNKPFDDLHFGGVYGFLEPNFNAAKPAGEWQEMEITLIGRRITVVANGITILQNQIIPGITGGAIDSKEGEPGPIMLQGDHEPIEYKTVTLIPRVD